MQVAPLERVAELADLEELVGLAHPALHERDQGDRQGAQRPVARAEAWRPAGPPSGRRRGSSPAKTTEDFPLPEGPTTATSGRPGPASTSCSTKLVTAEEEGRVLLAEREQAPIGAWRGGLLGERRPRLDERGRGDDEGGLDVRSSIGRDRHPDHAVRRLVPDRAAAEAGGDEEAGLLRVLDLHPAVGLAGPQHAGGPDPAVVAGREPERAERMVPRVVDEHQAGRPTLRGRVGRQLQDRDVVTARGRDGGAGADRVPGNDSGGQRATGREQGEVELHVAGRGLRHGVGNAEGLGDDVGTGQDVALGDQETGPDDRTARTEDAHGCRPELAERVRALGREHWAALQAVLPTDAARGRHVGLGSPKCATAEYRCAHYRRRR